jgi:hypothetical protein
MLLEKKKKKKKKNVFKSNKQTNKIQKKNMLHAIQKIIRYRVKMSAAA